MVIARTVVLNSFLPRLLRSPKSSKGHSPSRNGSKNGDNNSREPIGGRARPAIAIAYQAHIATSLRVYPVIAAAVSVYI